MSDIAEIAGAALGEVIGAELLRLPRLALWLALLGVALVVTAVVIW